MRARGAELKRMDKDRELPVVVRLICGGLAGGISQTGKSYFFSNCKVRYFRFDSQTATLSTTTSTDLTK